MCVSSLICNGTGQSESSNGLQRATVFSVQRFEGFNNTNQKNLLQESNFS